MICLYFCGRFCLWFPVLLKAMNIKWYRIFWQRIPGCQSRKYLNCLLYTSALWKPGWKNHSGPSCICEIFYHPWSALWISALWNQAAEWRKRERRREIPEMCVRDSHTTGAENTIERIIDAVSYTHLDVYKRQDIEFILNVCFQVIQGIFVLCTGASYQPCLTA